MSKRSLWRALAWAGLLVGGGSCALSVAPTGSSDRELTMELAVYPERVSVEDSTATAEVWATVRRGDRAIEDSTLVVFATTVGRITASSLTRDGLAVAILSTPGDGRPRRGEVVAQALTVRDTLEVDFVLLGEE
ncbi:MAG: hypothetical protein WDA75_03230 [Candidatus Latescibacterota bacterium]